VIGLPLDSLETIIKKRRAKLKIVLYPEGHFLHDVFDGLSSSLRDRLVMLQCFVAAVVAAVNFYKEQF